MAFQDTHRCAHCRNRETGWEMSTCLKHWHQSEDPQAQSAQCAHLLCLLVFIFLENNRGKKVSYKNVKEERCFVCERSRSRKEVGGGVGIFRDVEKGGRKNKGKVSRRRNGWEQAHGFSSSILTGFTSPREVGWFLYYLPCQAHLVRSCTCSHIFTPSSLVTSKTHCAKMG